MVATRLSEVTAKGIDWVYGGSSSSSTPNSLDNNSPADADSRIPNVAVVSSGSIAAADDSSYWSYATSSLQSAVDQTHAALAGLVASVLYEGEASVLSDAASTSSTAPPVVAVNDSSTTTTSSSRRRSSRRQSVTHPEIGSLLLNPHIGVRGRHINPQSLDAIRSLLTLVPVVESNTTTDGSTATTTASASHHHRQESIEESIASLEQQQHPSLLTRAETASQLAEGTLRALRDVTLDEAVELHDSLRYWTSRWERPVLSWMEAGPWVWFSTTGYNHKDVGQKVSQIQAVLARRCAAIGELQQHLLRASWQQGVAQWGVLGQGGQWAAVSGFDGAMEEQSSSSHRSLTTNSQDYDRRRLSTQSLDQMAPVGGGGTPLVGIDLGQQLRSSSSQLPSFYYGYPSVFVRNTDGGTIETDNPALAAWSVDAMKLVRDQLFRAGNGQIVLPRGENWASEDGVGFLITREAVDPKALPVWATIKKVKRDSAEEKGSGSEMGMDFEAAGEEVRQDDEQGSSETAVKKVTFEELKADSNDVGDDTVGLEEVKSVEEIGVDISDLPLMAAEVADLLDSMEVIMQIQRSRRLEKLKALSRTRRGWYKIAVAVPVGLYVVYRLLRNRQGVVLAKLAVESVTSFCQEHVAVPLRAIFNELLTRKNRDTISDRKARLDAIETLKKMIRSWLDETFPQMPVNERIARAESMDMSLIEQKKEASMKTFYEINSVIRMSFIEMQFIKKEMMNALYAMDEMMTSNDINFNLAAVTPAVLLIYTTRYVFKFLYYALLRLGKSREETYASFRHVILDIERLLVMRNHPPSAPPPLQWGASHSPLPVEQTRQNMGPSVLNADDLGMLMLHIHECRTILWKDRGRFSPQVLRDIAEDLAELAGERGIVSVQQQLLIISRMCRTYPFLKVVSTGVSFDLSRTSRI